MFKTRTQAPAKWAKIWNNRANGGLSWCINGEPVYSVANVLANCVGYACSRFNEIYNELTGYDGLKYPQLCCNAEVFYTVADQIGLKKGPEPKPGAIMCWEGLGDAPGHVAIVERVTDPVTVYTSESGYGGPFFWNATRHKGTGNWGAGSGYRFKGFIYNPAVKELTWKQAWKLYEDGKMVTGWKKVNEEWYFMDPKTGDMLTGWLKDAGVWYYLTVTPDKTHKEGQMWRGWLKDKDKWYYLNPEKTKDAKEGQMLTGWQKIRWNNRDCWFYFNVSGVMLTGIQTINGKQYKFDDNGVWIE